MKYSDDCKVYRIRYYNVWFYLFAKTEMDTCVMITNKTSTNGTDPVKIECRPTDPPSTTGVPVCNAKRL